MKWTTVAIGSLVALALMTTAVVVPVLSGIEVEALGLPPLFADYMRRFGPGTPLVLAIALAVGIWGMRAADKLRLPALLLTAWAVALAWMLGLDAIDGWSRLGGVLASAGEYLPTARAVADQGLLKGSAELIGSYIERIPLDHPNNLPVHLAGHPPAAVLFFAVLVSLGVTSTWWIGFIVAALAATIPVAIVLTLRELHALAAGRAIVPFLVTAPAAIWLAVSADAVFATVGAWGIMVLSKSAARATTDGRTIAWALVSGLLLGIGTFMNYGFPLIGLVAITVLLVARNFRPLMWSVLAALVVAFAFALAGFAWWEAYPVLEQRYWDGLASARPPSYWLWANIAALLFATGPVLGVGVLGTLGALVRNWRGIWSGAELSGQPMDPEKRVIVLVSLAAILMVVFADLSNMSRAEVERIWLFMVPWLLVSVALIPPRSRRWVLILNLVFSVVVGHTVLSAW